MTIKHLFLAGTLALAPLPLYGAQTSMQLVITLEGNAQRDVASYQCEGIEEPLVVEYVNAHPNFLALITIEDEPLILVNTIAASGARYVSGRYVWHSQGAEALLIDEMADEEAEPIACISAADIP